MRAVFLKGERIFLGPLSKKLDLKTYASWLNDPETTLYMGSGKFPSTVEGLKKYIDLYNNSRDGMLLGIFTIKNSRHIGNISLHMIDWRSRNGEIGIVIGEKKAWGQGYSTEAIKLVVWHAFNKLNLHKLYAGMIDGNEPSWRAFKSCGFKKEGLLEEHFYLNGKYLDCFRVGLLKKDFKC